LPTGTRVGTSEAEAEMANMIVGFGIRVGHGVRFSEEKRNKKRMKGRP
jgi:hypothetical protein